MFCFTTRHNTQNIFSTPSYLKMFLIPPLMKNEIGLWNEIYSEYVLKISEFNRFQPFELKLPVNNVGLSSHFKIDNIDQSSDQPRIYTYNQTSLYFRKHLTTNTPLTSPSFADDNNGTDDNIGIVVDCQSERKLYPWGSKSNYSFLGCK